MRIPPPTHQTTVQITKWTQSSVPTILKYYRDSTAIAGAIFFGNEGFWEGVRISESDKRKRVFVPLTTVAGAALGTIIGITFIPAVGLLYACMRFKTAYEERKTTW